MNNSFLSSLGLGGLDIGIILIVMAVIILILFILLVVNICSVSKLKKKYTIFMTGNTAKSLEIVYQNIEEKLKQKLSTKVLISPKGNGSGKIEIEFYSHEDLDKLIDLLSQ